METTSFQTKKGNRLIFAITGFLTAILIFNAIVSAYALRESAIKDKSEQLASLSLILAEHTSQTIFSANTVLLSILDTIEAAKIDNEKDFNEFASKKHQYDLLLDKTKANSIIDVATFVNKDGKVLNFSRSFPAPEINLADRDYFQWLSKHNSSNTFYSVPVQNKGNGKWVFYLVKRVNGRNQQFLGLVLIGVSVEVFSTLYERIGKSLGNGASLTLFRDDYTLLTRWKFVNHMIGLKNQSTSIKTSLANANINNGVILTDAPGFIRGNEPIDRMVSFRTVDGYPLIVGAIITKDLYLSNWLKSASPVFFTTAFSIFLLITGVLLLLKARHKNILIQHIAHHDSLTNLPNRLLLSDHLKHQLAFAKRNKTKFALVFIDLDNFKKINDEHTHVIGDLVLKEAAKKILNCIRDSDTISRIGGDEFILLLPNINSIENTFNTCEKIRLLLNNPFTLNGKEFSTSASIGVSIFPDHGQSEDELILRADQAMYFAKKAGRNIVKIFSKEMDTE